MVGVYAALAEAAWMGSAQGTEILEPIGTSTKLGGSTSRSRLVTVNRR